MGRKVAILWRRQRREMVLRELLNDRLMGYVVVGFIYTNPARHGFSIHGVPIPSPAPKQYRQRGGGSYRNHAFCSP
ncbi:nucleoside-diphosphate sugar epimerase/dehydratase [Neomoorella humiferrea]|uniref:nucleoside-diphosphate sugar epimerase/dehydratase n=1 Tax=Neomoorella humiferrea TaxID=676965 RepID=UPI0030D5294E